MAAMLDPAGNGFDIADLVTVFVIIASIVGAIAALWRWIAKPQIAAQITEATKPIQSSTNGDSINARVNLIIERQDEIVDDIRAVREDVQEVRGRVASHMQWHLDHTEGRERARSTDLED